MWGPYENEKFWPQENYIGIKGNKDRNMLVPTHVPLPGAMERFSAVFRFQGDIGLGLGLRVQCLVLGTL